jgi:hypothetical protein
MKLLNLVVSALTAALVAAVVAWGQTRVTSPGAGVPKGASVLVSSGACPGGFAEDTTARGRFIVAAPASGTVGGTVGVALTDLQDVTHQHTVGGGEDGSGHFHNDNAYGTGGSFATGSIVQTNNTTASTTNTRPLVSGSSTGHPYLQVTLCKKS